MTIIAVGRLRETFWKEAEAEYLKRLAGHTSKIVVVEVADEPTPEAASEAQNELIRQKEATRILSQVGERDYVIALDSAGKSLNSVRFAAHLEYLATEGNSVFTYIIGGSLGLHTSVHGRANLVLSFGAFTYPHQLMRIILLEQLYRASKIARGENYHK